MDLIKALNDYFGYEVETAQEFKSEFKKDILPHAQVENLLNFILYLDRQIERRDA